MLAPPTDQRRIFLVGYRGAGKSAVARLLAERLGWDWVDADQVLEQRQGQSIRQIFATGGELEFRNLEAAILAELCVYHRHVIAVGGGVVMRAENRQRLKDSGTVVWLTADPATLWQRLLNDPTTPDRRPDLTSGGMAEVETLLRLRVPLYAECAHVVVDTVNCTPAQVVEAILGNDNAAWCSSEPHPASGIGNPS
jgi:shikimate kinase